MPVWDSMYQQLENKLGYTFKDKTLIDLAMRHPSGGSPNNQRLEFLGDAVLELAVSHSLYYSLPGEREGEMTFIRQRMVCEDALFRVAEELNLGKYIMMEHGLARQGGRHNAAALSDAMEALLAAVYLDGGFDAAKAVIDRLLPVESTARLQDYKSTLQQKTQALWGCLPEDSLVRESGPDHAPLFTVDVIIAGTKWGSGTGKSKKNAEQSAAQQALDALKRHEDD